MIKEESHDDQISSFNLSGVGSEDELPDNKLMMKKTFKFVDGKKAKT